MNRAEYGKLLDDVCRELQEPGGNFAGADGVPRMNPEDIRAIAAVALLAADRYYSNLTKLLAERKDL